MSATDLFESEKGDVSWVDFLDEEVGKGIHDRHEPAELYSHGPHLVE